MSGDILQQIQSVQFVDKSRAETLLISFIRDTFPLDVQSVELRPLAVSLNSFNGFMTLADGRRLFFKTHTEPDTIIHEYYHASTLAKAGYPVIQPIYSSTEVGKQFLIYDVVDDPSVFDLAWAIENGRSDQFDALAQAQHDADDQLLGIYLKTLEEQAAEAAAAAPIHQLFYHRLVGGRLGRFYGDVNKEASPTLLLPHGEFPMSTVRQVQWVINGHHYSESINAIIERATAILNPHQNGPSIVGHGDAHNGNVFFSPINKNLFYFDPAFAGRHHPLLDLTKPLFHNVFAMWMYFPREKREQTSISVVAKSDLWELEYQYTLHPVREMFLDSKVKRVLIPILKELKQRGRLRPDWRTYLKASLFCCPFLTMNLADTVKFPPEISLLGLVMAVEMGAESSSRRSIIDTILDSVDAELTQT
jgi:hypothetical protein